MLTCAEFRTGAVSLPVSEADAVPECCFACPCLQQKAFSTSEEAVYLYCSYYDADAHTPVPPPCLPR